MESNANLPDVALKFIADRKQKPLLHQSIPQKNRPCIVINLSSGKILEVAEIGLYSQRALQYMASIEQQAKQSLAGVSSGLGFLGSPGYVLSGAIALGAIEGFMSNAARKRGLKCLAEYDEARISLMSQPTYFPVNEVSNISIPAPWAWSARSRSSEKSTDELFSHNGEEFIAVRDAQQKAFYIRWSDVSVVEPKQC